MKTPETHEAHPSDRSGAHRLLPMAGITGAIVAILAHLGGGAMLIHIGFGTGLAALGIHVGRLGGGVLVAGLVIVISLKLLMVFGAGHRQEVDMLVRTTMVQTQPGQVDEFVRRWRDVVAPHVPEMPELRRVYLCGNRETNTVMTIHLWDTPPDEMSHKMHDRPRFRDHVRDILASGEPVTEEYEVFATE